MPTIDSSQLRSSSWYFAGYREASGLRIRPRPYTDWMSPIPYSPSGIAHFGSAVIALGSGAWVLLTRKGTRVHIRVGWLYVGSIAFADISAMAVHHLTGGYNFFHALAILSL